MNINIHIEGLDDLSEAVSLLASAIGYEKQMPKKQEQRKVDDKKEEVKVVESEKAKYTTDDIREKAAELRQKKGISGADLKKTINSVTKTPQISKIPDEDVDAVMEALLGLEG